MQGPARERSKPTDINFRPASYSDLPKFALSPARLPSPSPAAYSSCPQSVAPHPGAIAGPSRGSSALARNLLPPQELLDDLCSRFVLNCSKRRSGVVREDLISSGASAEDNSVEQNPFLKSLCFKESTSLMFNSCSTLRPYIAHIDDIYKDFTYYNFRVPVSGVIILDESYGRRLLVNGQKAGASWSFPRGKRSKDEEDHICAVREASRTLTRDTGHET